jgi:hypothetical protein
MLEISWKKVSKGLKPINLSKTIDNYNKYDIINEKKV